MQVKIETNTRKSEITQGQVNFYASKDFFSTIYKIIWHREVIFKALL